MASMKDYLEKAMLRLGSRGAMPGERVITYSVETFVAPGDGYAECHALGTENDFLAIHNSTFQAVTWLSVPGCVMICHVPIKKGETCTVGKGSNVKFDCVNFVKSFGGA